MSVAEIEPNAGRVPVGFDMKMLTVLQLVPAMLVGTVMVDDEPIDEGIEAKMLFTVPLT